MNSRQKISTYDVAAIGLMAAMVFLATMFLKIKIPTPTGSTMLKLSNAVCLMGALLFGNWRGGLAAGLGGMFYDLTDAEYAAGAPITFIFYFLMAFLCGTVAYAGGGKGERTVQNVLAAVTGAFSYVLLYISKSIFTLTIYGGSAFGPAFISTVPKMITSLTNAVFAVVVASILAPVLRKGLKQAGIYQRIAVGRT